MPSVSSKEIKSMLAERTNAEHTVADVEDIRLVFGHFGSILK